VSIRPRPTSAQARTLKGLQDMRTSAAYLSGKPGEVEAHKLHMRLCVLEMERHRRDQERRVALERAAKCEARCRVLDQEVRSLLALMARPEPPVVVTPRGKCVTPAPFTHLY
jgi:hypothetical protein